MKKILISLFATLSLSSFAQTVALRQLEVPPNTTDGQVMTYFGPANVWFPKSLTTTPTYTSVNANAYFGTTNNFPLAVGAINLDWSAGYQFISTNASFTLNGFVNANNTLVNQVLVSVSNSSASSITFTWTGLGIRNYGTNTATSGPISSGKTWLGTFLLNPHGTNLINPLMQNN